MALPVTLGAATWDWRLDGETALDHWLARRPWQGPGSVLSIQAPRTYEAFDRFLERKALAADASTSALRVARLELDRRRDLRAELSAWMGVGATSWRALATALADDLLERPTLFLTAVADDASIDATLDTALELVDLTSKGGAERGPAILFLHHAGRVPLRGTCRHDRGWPAGIATECVERPPSDAWRAYLHVRIAWETGGILDDAYTCDALQPAGLRPGDDEAVERMLGEFAQRQFVRLNEPERQAWRRYAGVPGTRPPVFGHEEAPAGHLTPYPWLARALLLDGSTRLGARPLRAELVCRPLAERVMMTCFLAETQLRGQIPDTVVGTPLSDAVAAFHRFQTGASLEADIYPANHPAPPSDVWDFASMGSILPLVGRLPPSSRRLFEQAKLLRNAVAHGHNVGWHAMVQAREVAELLRAL
jgi:hypothetical protein